MRKSQSEPLAAKRAGLAEIIACALMDIRDHHNRVVYMPPNLAMEHAAAMAEILIPTTKETP